MNLTNVGWDDCFPAPFFTANPFIGCSKASEGCENCYAERMTKRLARMNSPISPLYEEVANWDGRTLFLPERLNKVRSHKGGGTIFWGSMSDLFHERNDGKNINEVWTTIFNKPQMTHVVLTKRPERLKAWTESAAKAKCWPIHEIWPENVYLGVTAENQARADERIPILLSIPGNHKRFVSVEPMLGEIRIGNFLWQTFDTGGQRCDGSWIQDREPSRELDLIIVGPENGQNKRPCKREWILDLKQQCDDAGVRCFSKEGARKLVEK